MIFFVLRGLLMPSNGCVLVYWMRPPTGGQTRNVGSFELMIVWEKGLMSAFWFLVHVGCCWLGGLFGMLKVVKTVRLPFHDGFLDCCCLGKGAIVLEYNPEELNWVVLRRVLCLVVCGV